MPEKHKIWQIIEYALWLVALGGLFFFIWLRLLPGINNQDLWLHLKTGEYILQNKIIPSTDIFSFTAEGRPWIDHSWLVQIIFYLVFNSFGPYGLGLLSLTLLAGAFLFLCLNIYPTSRSLTLNLSLVSLVIFTSAIRFNIHPENFSILFLAFYLWIIKRFVHTRWLFLLVPIQLIWVNCHGFWLLGPLILGIFILVAGENRCRLLGLLLLVCLVSLINPYGYKGVFYPFKITFEGFGKSAIFYQYIQELIPPWQLSYKSGVNLSAYYILIILSGLALIINPAGVNPAYFLLWLILLAMSWRANRNLVFFNLVAAMVIVDGLSKKLNLINRVKKLPPALTYLSKYALILIIITWTLKNNYFLLNIHFGQQRRGYPEEAINLILKNNLPDNLFNLTSLGPYLIYRLYPQKKVFIDGRIELYGQGLLRDYLELLQAPEDRVDRLFKKYRINSVILNSNDPNGNRLWQYLFNDKGRWALVYFAPEAAVFVRR